MLPKWFHCAHKLKNRLISIKSLISKISKKKLINSWEYKAYFSKRKKEGNAVLRIIEVISKPTIGFTNDAAFLNCMHALLTTHI